MIGLPSRMFSWFYTLLKGKSLQFQFYFLITNSKLSVLLVTGSGNLTWCTQTMDFKMRSVICRRLPTGCLNCMVCAVFTVLAANQNINYHSGSQKHKLSFRVPKTHCKDSIPKIRNKYSQKWNCAASVPIPTFKFLWAIYIFPQSRSAYSAAGK